MSAEKKDFEDIKIGFIFGGDYVSFPVGGTLYYVNNLLRYWSLGKVTLFGSAPISTHEKLYASTEIKIGSKNYTLYVLYRHKNKKSKYLPERIKFLLLLYLFKDDICDEVDVLYFHAPELVLPFIKCKKIKVLHMHGAPNPLVYSRFKIFRRDIFIKHYNHKVYFPVLKNIDFAIPTTKECIELYEKVSGKTINFYLPTCVDTEEFIPPPQYIKTRIVLYTGRVANAKGLDLLVRSAKYLLGKDIEIHIRGEGEMKNDLIRLTRTIGVDSIVHFYPFVKREKLPEVYRNADVFVLPTLGEGFSMVKLEAMASGIPVIVTKTTTAEGVIDGFNGYVLEKRDPKLLAELILKAIENKEFLGRNARKTVERYYSAEVVTRQIENVIKYVITKDKRYLNLVKTSTPSINDLS